MSKTMAQYKLFDKYYRPNDMNIRSTMTADRNNIYRQQ